jgi:hypothetical protein
MPEQENKPNVTKINLWPSGDANFGLMVLFMGLGVGGCEMMQSIGKSYPKAVDQDAAIIKRIDEIEKKMDIVLDRQEILRLKE